MIVECLALSTLTAPAITAIGRVYNRPEGVGRERLVSGSQSIHLTPSDQVDESTT